TQGAGAVGQIDFPVGQTSWVSESGLLSAVVGTTMTSVVRQAPYNAPEHHYLRIQEEAGAIYWATSADGAAFQPFASFAGGPYVSSGRRVVGVSTVATATNAGSAVWGTVTMVGP